MFFDARRCLAMSLVALLLSACSGGMVGSSTPSASSNQSDRASTSSSGADDLVLSMQTAKAALDAAPLVTSPGRALMGRIPIRPNAKAAAFLIDFVAAGEAQGGVPCISCVNGASTGDNIGLTGPVNYVPKGGTWQYTLSFSVLKLDTKCKLAWAITSGKKVIDSWSVDLKVKGKGGYVVYGLNRPWPSYSGSALLTGKVTCGKAGSQTTQAPLYFQ